MSKLVLKLSPNEDTGPSRLDARMGFVGRAMLRHEDDRLIRGQGRFVDDLAPEGCLFVEFLRPASGAGQIAALDCTAARAAPGVVALYTGGDTVGCASLPVNPVLSKIGDAPFRLLALNRMDAPGQAIAAVVATSQRAAMDAVELVDWRIKPLKEAASTAQFVGKWGVPISAEHGEGLYSVTLEIEHALLAPAALEPRAVLAMLEDGCLHVHASTQTPHRMRADLGVILDLDPKMIRITAPDVGGAFGGKSSISPEEALVAFAALRLGRPVKWIATRSEEFLAAPRGRGGASRGRLVLDAHGNFRSLDAAFSFKLGHWLPYSAAIPARNAARILPGPYAIGAVQARMKAESGPRAAVNIYRGAGRPEAVMLIERLVDEAAALSGIDPLTLRLRNLPPARKRRCSVSGDWFDTGNYRALLDALTPDYKALRRSCSRRRRAGEVTGIGLALYVEPCGQGWESGRVGLNADGRIIAATGASAQGQGRESAYAAIVADTLGLSPDDITVWHGDTKTTPTGIGALASRSTAIGGSAIRMAAEKFLETARPLMSAWRTGPDATLVEFARAHSHLARPDGFILSADAVYETINEAWASGAVLAGVTIDRETGELAIDHLLWADDAGNIVNPMLVEGQLLGGLAQGFGEAVMEALRFDASGELLTGSFQDYAMPRAVDVPKVNILSRPVPSRANPLGAKGVGEAGTIGIPAAIVNAAVDALRPFGVTHLNMPLTSEKLWRAMRGSGGTRQEKQS